VKSIDPLFTAKAIPLSMKRTNPLDVTIGGLPAEAPDKVNSVIAIKCRGEIATDTNRLLQPVFSSETLRAFDGELHGGLRFGPGKKTDDVVMNWTKTDQFITWPVRVSAPTAYEVIAHYDADSASAGNTFVVTFKLPDKAKLTMAPDSVTGVVKAGKQQSESIGQVRCWIANEPFEIKLSAGEIKEGELFRLRSLELRPVPLLASESAK
jgi:hypothetical protein